jgi:hypothetical protein
MTDALDGYNRRKLEEENAELRDTVASLTAEYEAAIDRVAILEAENERLRRPLRIFADPEMWTGGLFMGRDGIDLAAEALQPPIE